MVDMPEQTEASSYADIQGEVNKHFGGDWQKFLLGVDNAAEILHFVFAGHCKKDRETFQGWGKRQGLPDEWFPRFYMALDEEGDLKPKNEW